MCADYYIRMAETVTHVENGIIKIYDAYSGELVSSSDHIPTLQRWNYSLEIGAAIVDLVRQGNTLVKIGKMKGFPNVSTIYRWGMLHPDFKEKIELARKDRAEYFHDKVIETIEEVSCKEDVPAAKLKVDGYRWAAEKGDKDRYGNSSKIDINTGGIQYINTGIPEDTTFDEIVEAEYTEMEEDECRESSAGIAEQSPGTEQKGAIHVGGNFKEDQDTGHGLRTGDERASQTSEAARGMGRDQTKRVSGKDEHEQVSDSSTQRESQASEKGQDKISKK